MADEYINKTELLFEMATSLIPQSMDITMGYAIAKDLIRKAPVADVAPVVHGEWIPIVSYFHGKPTGKYYCSVCHRVETMKGIYCRLCGALMDGGKKNV
jgi:hypothetical protein